MLPSALTRSRHGHHFPEKIKKHQHKLHCIRVLYDGGIETGTATHESHKAFKITKCSNLKKLFDVRNELGVLGILYWFSVLSSVPVRRVFD